MNIIRMSGGLGNQMFQYALGMKLKSQGKEVKFDDINEYRDDDAKPIMLAVFGLTVQRATWDEINEFTDGSMKLKKESEESCSEEEPMSMRSRGCLIQRCFPLIPFIYGKLSK